MTRRCPYVTSTTAATFDADPARRRVRPVDNIWKHDYTVTVNPDGTFTGNGIQNGNDGWPR